MAEHAIGTVKGALTADGTRAGATTACGPAVLNSCRRTAAAGQLAPARVAVGAHALELPAQQFCYLTHLGDLRLERRFMPFHDRCATYRGVAAGRILTVADRAGTKL